MRRCVALGSLLFTLLGAEVAFAETFPAGSLIIPMDTDYQDVGMFKAYGLVYQLLLHDVPVQWTIRGDKAFGGADFTTSATDYATGAPIGAHGYRAGPWVVRANDAAAAQPIVDAWQAANTTTVHVASAQFDVDVAKHLITAPTIAMFADGNQKIARTYVQAAGIPDSTGDLAWPDTSPDMLTVDEVAGPTDTDHADGALFDDEGRPVYCQLMSMHWGVATARENPEVVAEVRQFLSSPTHFFAECQAVNAFENDPVNGLFLTTNGFIMDDRPNAVDFFNPASPFAQIDGAFATVGGSEPSYSLQPGPGYKTGGITMITGAGTPEGHQDVWMTGYLDGACPPNSETCGKLGKVSYLGGHEYNTAVPISKNPDSQGTRLFLNSLFEAQCATAAGQPDIVLQKLAPANTSDSHVTFDLSYVNSGAGVALEAKLRDEIPAGTSFVSATAGGTLTGNEVRWALGNLNSGEGGTVSFTVSLPAHGVYENTAHLDYRVGLNTRTETSNTTSTQYADGAAGSAGAAGGGGNGGTAGAGASAGASGASGTSGMGGQAGAQTGGAGASPDAGTAGSGAQTGVDASGATAEDSGGCGCRTRGGADATAVWLLTVGAAWLLRRRRLA